MPLSSVRERPILFSGEMVRAILEGRKTQTRRVIDGADQKHWPILGLGTPEEWMAATENRPPLGGYPKDRHLLKVRMLAGQETLVAVKCPFGVVGDRLWVRETWQHEDSSCADWKCGQPSHIYYRATEVSPETMRWKPSIFMPRWASRITLEVTRVRVERVQGITAEDAKAEGIPTRTAEHTFRKCYRDEVDAERVKRFAALWDSINARRGFPWSANPWVWVVEFRRVEVKNAAE